MGSQNVGVEIHPRGVRVARVQTSAKGIQVQHVAEAGFPEGTTLTSLDPASLPEAVGAALDPRPLGGRRIVVVLDHPSVVLTTFALAAGFTDELGTSIKWYAEQYVPYPVDQAAVDFRVQDSPYGGRKTIFLVSIQRAVVDIVMKLLPPKRVKLRHVDAVPYSLARLHRRLAAEPNGPTELAVLVHAAGLSAYVLVTHAGRMGAVRHVRLAEPAVASLAEIVRQTCLHYEFHHPAERIEAAYATLPALAPDGAREQLEAALGVEVRALDPARAGTLVGRGEGADPDGRWAETYSLAVGAAI